MLSSATNVKLIEKKLKNAYSMECSPGMLLSIAPGAPGGSEESSTLFNDAITMQLF